MGKRGPRIDEALLAQIYHVLVQRKYAPKVIRTLNIPKTICYRYIKILEKEGSIQKIGQSPAEYEPLPKGRKYDQANSVLGPQNSGQPAFGGAIPKASTGEPPPPASGLEVEPEVSALPPRVLDQPARVHHIKLQCRINQGSDRHPVPDLLRWSPFKMNRDGDPWYRQASVLLDKDTIVVLQEFPGKTMRFYLQERVVETDEDLKGVMDAAAVHTQRISWWLQKHYGYRFGLPEYTQDTEIGFALPMLQNKFKGSITVEGKDGTRLKIDQSKGSAELEFLIRNARESADLERVLAWANAPSLLMELISRVNELESSMPTLISTVVSKAIKDAALDKTIEDAVKRAIDQAFAYRKGGDASDNAGYR